MKIERIRPARRYEATMVALLCVTIGLSSFEMMSIDYLMPFIKPDLNLTNTQVGILISGLAVAYAVSGGVAGPLVGMLRKPKAVLLCLLLVFSGASILSGFASSFHQMLGARICMGMLEGPVIPIAQSIIAIESSSQRRGANMGLAQTFGTGIFAIIAPMLLVGLAKQHGWQAGFYVVCLPALLLAFLVFVFLREVKAPSGESYETVAESPGIGALLRDVLAYRNVWLCAAATSCLAGGIFLGSAFYPLYLVTDRQLTHEQMGFLMSAPGVSCLLLGFFWPMLSDRIGRRPVIATASLLGMICPLLVMYLPYSLALFGGIMFLGWGLAGIAPLCIATVPSETVPPGLISTAIGLISAIGTFVGGIVAPVVGGWSADHWGLAAPLYLQAACGLGAASFALLLSETAPARRGRAVAAMGI
jgi:MFS family permease